MYILLPGGKKQFHLYCNASSLQKTKLCFKNECNGKQLETTGANRDGPSAGALDAEIPKSKSNEKN